MFYVYILHSARDPGRRYVGFSSDLKRRLADHNTGNNASTRSGKPWKLSFYAGFPDKEDAMRFEAYLKTASGKALAKKGRRATKIGGGTWRNSPEFRRGGRGRGRGGRGGRRAPASHRKSDDFRHGGRSCRGAGQPGQNIT